jgi:hypothetical protein
MPDQGGVDVWPSQDVIDGWANATGHSVQLRSREPECPDVVAEDQPEFVLGHPTKYVAEPLPGIGPVLSLYG